MTFYEFYISSDKGLTVQGELVTGEVPIGGRHQSATRSMPRPLNLRTDELIGFQYGSQRATGLETKFWLF